jgi:hypothetical protein
MPSADLIPQAKLVSEIAPTASSLSGSTIGIHGSNGTEGPSLLFNPAGGSVASVSLSLATIKTSSQTVTPTAINGKTTKQLKGGLTLVYDPEGEGEEEISIEESRAFLPRYQKFFLRAAALKA